MMNRAALFDHILLDDCSSMPKYMQLANAIIQAIEARKIEKNFILPSINELSFQLEVSRDTVEKSYKHLKKIGIVNSVPGKGYYIANTSFKQKLKIFLLFNKLSAHKKLIYDAFVSALGEEVLIDFYIYNNNFNYFKRLLSEKKEDYSHYVIIPHFIEDGEKAFEIINTLPKDKLILLDKKIPGVNGAYGAVYENFEKDIFGALEQARAELHNYKLLKLIFPSNSYFPVEIVKGLVRFCAQYKFAYQLVYDIHPEPVSRGEVYINLMEDDLVILLEKIIALGLVVGKDVGVISYNETPIKKILLNGITTISTDFQFMGAKAAEMVTGNSMEHVEIPFHYTHRASL